MKTTIIILYLFTVLIFAQDSSKKELLEVYSFDFSAHKPPLTYTSYGTSVELISKTKLIQQVKGK